MAFKRAPQPLQECAKSVQGSMAKLTVLTSVHRFHNIPSLAGSTTYGRSRGCEFLAEVSGLQTCPPLTQVRHEEVVFSFFRMLSDAEALSFQRVVLQNRM